MTHIDALIQSIQNDERRKAIRRATIMDAIECVVLIAIATLLATTTFILVLAMS